MGWGEGVRILARLLSVLSRIFDLGVVLASFVSIRDASTKSKVWDYFALCVRVFRGLEWGANFGSSKTCENTFQKKGEGWF